MNTEGSQRSSIKYDGSNPPIFILSCQRSGSTLLRYIVDGHPEICCPGHLFLGELCQNLYYASYYSVAQLSHDASEEEREYIAVEEVRKVISNLMDRYATSKNKKSWCEKSALNVDQLDTLKRVFPEAKNICLYRHCMDVVHSCLKYSPYGFMRGLSSYVQKNPDNIVAAMIECWVERTKKLLEFEHKNAGQCYRVKYESLVSSPTETLELMFRFLGFPWDERMLDRIFSHQHDTGDGDLKVGFSKQITTASLGKGMSIPSIYIPDELLEKMNQLLLELEYQPLGSTPEIFEADVTTIDNGLAQNFVSERIRNIFASEFPEAIKRKPNRFQTLNAKCQFVVSGAGGGNWVIDLTQLVSETQVRIGQEETDCTIAVPANILIDLVDGRLNPIEVYEERKIGGSGNLDLAIKFGQLLLSK